MPRPTRTSILLAARGLDPVGTGGQVELLARGLAAVGWSVHVAALSGGGSLAGRLAAAGVPVHVVGRRPVVDAAAMAGTIGLASRLRPAAVLAFGRGLAGFAVALKAALPRTAAAALVAVPFREHRTPWLLRRLDLVVAATSGTAASCRRGGVPAARLTEIPPGIEPPAAAVPSRMEVAARLGLDPAKHWTLCVAPLVAESRLERLLWAIDQLGVVRRDVAHVLVGGGPLAGRLARRAFVQELSDRLVIMPHCPLLPDLLDQVAFVWQSGAVAHGGAILDAMPRGVPAVAVESDAARSLIADDLTGRIVPAVPESEFPRRAFGLLEEPGLAARYGAAARARAAELFPADRAVSRVSAALERIL